MKRRFLSLLIVFSMIMSMFPVQTFAYEVSDEDLVEGDYAYAYIKGKKTAEILGYLGSDSEITVPATIGGAVVTGIAPEAFGWNETITDVTLPEGLLHIGESAFQGCSALETVKLPDSVESIDAYAFAWCESLQEINYPLNWSIDGYGGIFTETPNLVEITVPEGVKEIPAYAFAESSLEKITLPESVEYIGSNAFSYCHGLEELALPEGVKELGNYVFSYSEALKEVELPAALEEIPEGTFYGCCAFERVEIPAGVEAIGNGAFSSCESLTEVVMGQSVASIGDNAFEYCTALEEIALPDSVEYIGSYAFSNCTELTEFRYPSGWNESGGDIFSDCESLTEITVPEGVTDIPAYAFRGAVALETVTLPESLETIGEGAFAYCTALEEIALPAGLQEMGSYMFDGCENLMAVEIPDEVRLIPDNAFSGCTALEAICIPGNVETVGAYAFFGCESLAELTIEEGVAYIGDNAFEYCSALTEVAFPAGMTSLGNGVFMDCVSLESVIYPEDWSDVQVGYDVFAGCESLTGMLIPEGATEIPANAFAGASWLETVTVPESVEYIGDNAFENCTGLTEIILPEGLYSIGNYAFSGCESLDGVTLPESLAQLGDSAFANCTSLTSITIPAEVEYIGNYAFSGCESLESVEICEGVGSIGDGAFEYCPSLTAITLPDGLSYIGGGAFRDCEELESVTYPSDMEIVQWGGEVFAGCESLTSIEIPEGVINLPASMFSGSNWLESVTLPQSLEHIGEYAFSDCTELAEITLPENLVSIGNDAFYGCTALKEIVLPSCLEILGEGAFDGCTDLAQVQFNEELIEIGAYAFYGCERLTALEIPESVTTIGYNAFSGCRDLESINYPLGVTETGGDLFSGCSSLKSFVVPEGVTDLAGHFFAGADGLESVILPESLRGIGVSTFEGCTRLTNIVIPEGVTYIDEYAFSGCSRLSSITLPETLEILGCGAFSGCTRLNSVSIPGSVKEVGDNAFSGCTNLSSVLLGEGVTTLGGYAFYGCSRLTDVALPNSLETIYTGTFDGCTRLESLIVPDSVITIEEGAFPTHRKFVIYCNLNSEAAIYAIQYGIPMIDLGGEIVDEEGELLTLERENTYYKVDYDGISASGNLSLAAKYSFKNGEAPEGSYITFTFPETVQVLENTLRLNGETIEDYWYDDYENVFEIPVSGKEGVIRFSVKPLSYDVVTSYARISFDNGEIWDTEIVGTVYAELPILSLEATKQTSETEVKVSGVTIPRNEVAIYVDGVKTASAKANRLGDYSVTVPLESPTDGKRYAITAETMASGEKITAEATVTYREAAPVLTEFIMEHSGQVFYLQNIAGLRPVVTFVPGEPFRFTAKFENAQNVEALYIVSTRNNMKKYMEAKWDENQQAFVANGFFDPENTDYVPGSITIEYELSRGKVSFEAGYDFFSEEAKNDVPDSWKDGKATVVEQSDDRAEVIIQNNDGSSSAHISTERRPIPSGITEHNAESHGYRKFTDDYGRTMYGRYSEGAGEFHYDVLDFTRGEAIDYVVWDALLDAGPVGDILELGETFVDAHENQQDYEQMRRDILNARHLTADEKAQALDDLRELHATNTMISVMKVAVVTAGLLLPGGGVAVAVAGFAVGMLLDGMQSYTKYRMNSMMYDLMCGFRWAIDPSGYVYDPKKKKYLAGATVTVYWIPVDEDDPDFWENKPADDEYGEIWDAGEYSQMNPLITDEEGRYAWDVPEGWWRVEAVLEGYETTWSDWVPVPPVQTDVNIPMISLEEEEPLVESRVTAAIGGKGEVEVILTDAEGQEQSYVFADGAIDLTVQAGIFDLSIRRGGCLTYTITGITVEDGDNDLGTITLLAGDTNGDGMINIMDMGVFRQNFGKMGAGIANVYADTNGDNMVNIMDMSVFRSNFGKTARDCTVEYAA